MMTTAGIPSFYALIIVYMAVGQRNGSFLVLNAAIITWRSVCSSLRLLTGEAEHTESEM